MDSLRLPHGRWRPKVNGALEGAQRKEIRHSIALRLDGGCAGMHHSSHQGRRVWLLWLPEVKSTWVQVPRKGALALPPRDIWLKILTGTSWIWVPLGVLVTLCLSVFCVFLLVRTMSQGNSKENATLFGLVEYNITHSKIVCCVVCL